VFLVFWQKIGTTYKHFIVNTSGLWKKNYPLKTF
jgi:hypothetical protein